MPEAAVPRAARRDRRRTDRGGDRTAFELVVLAFETLQHVDITSAGAHREEVRLPMRPALPGARPRIDVYDTPRQGRSQRCFADVLRSAMGTPTL
jgi:hypothetical protein